MSPRRVDRFLLHSEIARGGMASVHLGRLRARGGFSRLVAIKLMHPHLAGDPQFTAMLLDEGRIVGRIRHPNVVSTLDVIQEGDTLGLVMDYVHGPSLSRILRERRDAPVPIPVALAIVSDMLEGLHAAHEARSESGDLLQIVHRDVSPQNVLVGFDGLARVADFGIAKASGQLHTTEEGSVRGKVGYMAPEQAEGKPVDRRADIYATGCVLFELLTGRRPFEGTHFAEVALKHINERAPRASQLRSEVSRELDAVIARALQKDREKRYASAHDMAEALDLVLPRATPREVRAWIGETYPSLLATYDAQLAAAERSSLHDAAEKAVAVAEDAEATRVDGSATRARPRPWALATALATTSLVVAALGWSMMPNARGPAMASPTMSAEPSTTPRVDTSAPAIIPTVSGPSSSELRAASATASALPAPPSTKPVVTQKSSSPRVPTRSATSSAAAPTPIDAPKTKCCDLSLGVRVKFKDCDDNCPRGM